LAEPTSAVVDPAPVRKGSVPAGDSPPGRQDKTRRRWLLLGCLTPILLVGLLAAGVLVLRVYLRARFAQPPGPGRGPQPAWVPAGKRFAKWASPPFAYNGPGRLDVYAPYGCQPGEETPDPEATGVSIAGKAVRCKPGFASKLVPSPRLLLVHLPPDYEKTTQPLPLIISLHGFGQRPHHAFQAFASYLDEALSNGTLPPAVTVFPDITLGGDGLDDVATPWDENGGNWGVNCNLGRYRDWLTQELLPFVLASYRVSDRPGQTVLLGGSMGGTIAFNLMLDDPKRFPIVGAFYPGFDLRYSCNGDRLAPYDPACYKPLTDDVPTRRMVTTPGLKGMLFTERFVLYPVFDSDKVPGKIGTEDRPERERQHTENSADRPRDGQFNLKGVHVWSMTGNQNDFNISSVEQVVMSRVSDSDKVPGTIWTEDRPVWERLRPENPVDRLRDGQFNLKSVHVWYVVGDHDDFNIFSAAPEFDRLIKKTGVDLQPDNHIRPGGHDLQFFYDHVREALAWTAKQLAAGR
jgi:hypothetical protein